MVSRVQKAQRNTQSEFHLPLNLNQTIIFIIISLISLSQIDIIKDQPVLDLLTVYVLFFDKARPFNGIAPLSI